MCIIHLWFDTCNKPKTDKFWDKWNCTGTRDIRYNITIIHESNHLRQSIDVINHISAGAVGIQEELVHNGTGEHHQSNSCCGWGDIESLQDANHKLLGQVPVIWLVVLGNTARWIEHDHQIEDVVLANWAKEKKHSYLDFCDAFKSYSS